MMDAAAILSIWRRDAAHVNNDHRAGMSGDGTGVDAGAACGNFGGSDLAGGCPERGTAVRRAGVLRRAAAGAIEPVSDGARSRLDHSPCTVCLRERATAGARSATADPDPSPA